MIPKHSESAATRWARLLLVVLALMAAGVFLVPVAIPVLPQPLNRPLSWDEARLEAEHLRGNEPASIRATCLPTLYAHPTRTRRAFLLLHGLSNCPRQFHELAALLHQDGANVFIPRMPYHGLEDRLTEEYGKLTLESLARWTAHSLEIARGLGEEVVVVGLSVNGTTAAWIAQERSDVHRVVVIAPFLAPEVTPVWMDRWVARLMLRLPNRFVWWDKEKREDLPGPPHAYPRFPTRVIGEFMALGQYVLKRAKKSPPACKRIDLVLTEADEAISVPVALKLADRWGDWSDVDLALTMFPLADAVPHDMIDVQQVNQRTDIVYPALREIFWKP